MPDSNSTLPDIEQKHFHEESERTAVEFARLVVISKQAKDAPTDHREDVIMTGHSLGAGHAFIVASHL